MTIAAKVLGFYQGFEQPAGLPDNVSLENPYDNAQRHASIDAFYNKYFNDMNPRIHILGINPSRLTTTATGVNYTDGFALQEYCDLPNDFSKTRELTADFFYRVVLAMGGTDDFYSTIFPWAMMPVTVTKKGNYANYYSNDIVEDMKSLVVENIKWTSELPRTGRVVILGTGENQKVFNSLPGSPFGYNDVRVLPHPRWIMQYNRDKVDKFVADYVDALS